ncbi:MAG: alanine/glycine:cation symporter family protein [bacterium]|nr:alanine/glycine:cation symporter family protein [bacterium]
MLVNLLECVKGWVWGPWLLIAMLATGTYFTVKSRFFQMRGFQTWWKYTAGGIGKTEEDVPKPSCDERTIGDTRTSTKKNTEEDTEKKIQKNTAERGRKHGVSQFQAACTALAATVGTGNIAGVATALLAGGPGAIFWMWVSSLAGMMTAYAENFLGVLYRERGADGHFHGGPMFYIEKGMGKKWLAFAYAVCVVLASFGMGSMVQANSMADTLAYTFHFPVFWTALILTGAAGLVLWGGIGRISKVAEKLVPFSAGIYLVLACVVVLANLGELPEVFGLIWREAFQPKSMLGGAMGYGVSRGVFSNEAGLGSLSILHSSTECTTPQEQGMWGIFDVFFDTILMCTLTAVAILVRPEIRMLFSNGGVGVTEEMMVQATGQNLNGAALASWAISRTVGEGGGVFIALSMVCFAFATIVGWYCLGSQAASYLTRGNLFLYRLLYLEAIFFGCVMQLKVVWALSDIFNGMMAAPNLLALFWLRKQVEAPEVNKNITN